MAEELLSLANKEHSTKGPHARIRSINHWRNRFNCKFARLSLILWASTLQVLMCFQLVWHLKCCQRRANVHILHVSFHPWQMGIKACLAKHHIKCSKLKNEWQGICIQSVVVVCSCCWSWFMSANTQKPLRRWMISTECLVVFLFFFLKQINEMIQTEFTFVLLQNQGSFLSPMWHCAADD